MVSKNDLVSAQIEEKLSRNVGVSFAIYTAGPAPFFDRPPSAISLPEERAYSDRPTRTNQLDLVSPYVDYRQYPLGPRIGQRVSRLVRPPSRFPSLSPNSRC